MLKRYEFLRTPSAKELFVIELVNIFEFGEGSNFRGEWDLAEFEVRPGGSMKAIDGENEPFEVEQKFEELKNRPRDYKHSKMKRRDPLVCPEKEHRENIENTKENTRHLIQLTPARSARVQHADHAKYF